MDSLGWVGFDPAPCWDKNRSGVLIPYTNLGQASAHPNEAMNSIKSIKLTGPASRLFTTQSRCSRPGNLSFSFGGNNWSRYLCGLKNRKVFLACWRRSTSDSAQRHRPPSRNDCGRCPLWKPWREYRQNKFAERSVNPKNLDRSWAMVLRSGVTVSIDYRSVGAGVARAFIFGLIRMQNVPEPAGSFRDDSGV